jgi:very-short-patch-repair endonuclease/ribosomal protein L37E
LAKNRGWWKQLQTGEIRPTQTNYGEPRAADMRPKNEQNTTEPDAGKRVEIQRECPRCGRLYWIDKKKCHNCGWPEVGYVKTKSTAELGKGKRSITERPTTPAEIIRSLLFGAFVIGDPPFDPCEFDGYDRRSALRLPKKGTKLPTRAREEFCKILDKLNNGVLRGKFQRDWTFYSTGKWILDFFFPENRLGIEIDGGYHSTKEQRQRDSEKEKACEAFDITLLRITNRELFGDREALIDKLREGYRKANERKKRMAE